MNPIPGANAVTSGDQGGATNDPWLKLAKDAFSRSTTYFENNFRKEWEDGLRMFQSRHPRDSKYLSDAYKFRSRLFRPKSRSVLRKNEATAALAFFSNPDVTSFDPGNSSLESAMGAELMKEIIQYRLTKTIPWFLTVIGGFQDAMNIGLVCSLQHWRYRQKMEKVTKQGQLPTGEVVSVDMQQPKVLEDRPCIDLFPIENVRFDPGAQWYDVAGTSPYIILRIPMYVGDVLDNMETQDRSGTKWTAYSKEEILQSRIKADDSMLPGRLDGKEDPADMKGEVNEFETVMVHLNFIRQGHETNCFYTLEDKRRLTDPVPLEEMFLHCKDGKPPVVIGFCVIETHRPVPPSLINLGSQLQRELNESVNSRQDNVKFVLNKRTLFRRGANIDIQGWNKNTPGSSHLVNDVEKDVRPVEYQDVTSSAFQEQDRMNVDFDELMGNFAQGSVLTNRKLNETVGGMRMMAQGANMLTEYTLRIFVETWAEPVLRQLARMESAYETDEVVLAVATDKAQFFQKYGQSPQLDSLLNQDLTLSVNVGMGATDPDTRFQRLMQAFGAYIKMVMEGSPDLNLPEIRKEVFGLAGFKDAARFFTQVDPRLAQAKKMLDGAQSQANDIVATAKERLSSRERALDQRENDINLKQVELQNEFSNGVQKLQQDYMLAEKEAQMKFILDQQSAANSMSIDEQKAHHAAQLAEFKAQQDARLAEFKAGVDAQVQMVKAHAAAAAAVAGQPKQKTAVKKSDGTWQITETSVEAPDLQWTGGEAGAQIGQKTAKPAPAKPGAKPNGGART